MTLFYARLGYVDLPSAQLGETATVYRGIDGHWRGGSDKAMAFGKVITEVDSARHPTSGRLVGNPAPYMDAGNWRIHFEGESYACTEMRYKECCFVKIGGVEARARHRRFLCPKQRSQFVQ